MTLIDPSHRGYTITILVFTFSREKEKKRRIDQSSKQFFFLKCTGRKQARAFFRYCFQGCMGWMYVLYCTLVSLVGLEEKHFCEKKKKKMDLLILPSLLREKKKCSETDVCLISTSYIAYHYHSIAYVQIEYRSGQDRIA